MANEIKNKALEKTKGKFPGWRTMSSSSRYNAKLHHIFEEGKRLNAIHDAGRKTHLEKGHKGEYSSCTKGCIPNDD